MQPHFYRDARNRLTHDRADIEALTYPEVCVKVAEQFSLQPSSELVVGPSQMFRDFTNGTSNIELAWDNWFGFTVTAKQPVAESLVRQIALFVTNICPERPEASP